MGVGGGPAFTPNPRGNRRKGGGVKFVVTGLIPRVAAVQT